MALDHIYIIGSLRNPLIPELGNELRVEGYNVFDDWFAAGPEADDYWQRYETDRGHGYGQALAGAAARNVFQFDLRNLMQSKGVVLYNPAGKSGHMEFGWMLGRGCPGWVLFDEEPQRWDVMYQFATGVCFSREELLAQMKAFYG